MNSNTFDFESRWPRLERLESGIEISIRRAKKGDGESIRRLILNSRTPTNETADNIEERLEHRKSLVWLVAEHDSLIVGEGRIETQGFDIPAIHRDRRPDAKEKYKGTGEKILAELEEIAWHMGAKAVALDADKVKLASYYERCGYDLSLPIVMWNWDSEVLADKINSAVAYEGRGYKLKDAIKMTKKRPQTATKPLPFTFSPQPSL